MYSINHSPIANSSRPPDNVSITYQVAGFDRVQFVSDVIQAVTLDGSTPILDLHFESDGIRAGGRVTIQSKNHYQTITLYERLRSVQGMVNVEQVRAM